MNSQFRWLVDRELKESFDQPEQARIYANMMANRSDFPSLSEAGVMYLVLREPVLVESCFWFIDYEAQEKGLKEFPDVVRIRYANWLVSKKRADEAMDALKRPAEEKLEHYRLQHLAKAHIAKKNYKEALKILCGVLTTRISLAGDKPDLFHSDLLRSTRFAIGYCLRNDKKLLKIRDAEKSDLSALTELAMRSKGFWPHPKDYVEACRPYFTLKPEDLKLQKIRVAEIEGIKEAVGFYGFIIDKKYLEHLFIEPKFTNCGIGSALWEDLLKWAKKAKIEEFEWMADPFSEVFYLKQGGKSVKKIPSRIKNGPEHVLMRYKL